MADLAAGAVRPAPQRAVEDHRAPDPGPEPHPEHVTQAAGGAEPELAEHPRVDVVVDADPRPGPSLELGAEGERIHPAGEVGASRHHPGGLLDGPRGAHADRRQPVRAGLAPGLVEEGAQRVDDGGGAACRRGRAAALADHLEVGGGDDHLDLGAADVDAGEHAHGCTAGAGTVCTSTVTAAASSPSNARLCTKQRLTAGLLPI